MHRDVRVPRKPDVASGRPAHDATADNQRLFESQSATLKLKWVAGHDGRARLLEPSTAKYPGMALVGHLNFVHPNRIQVIGEAEIKYLQNSPKPRARRRCASSSVASARPRWWSPTASRSTRISRPNPGARAWRCSPRRCRVRWSSTTSSSTSRARSRPRLTVHGVYMEVLGMGVLLTGEAGIGKSELALELLSRGHRLIAARRRRASSASARTLVGQCPGSFRIISRCAGLGILDIRLMFGETAVRHRKKLHLSVRLEKLDRSRMGKIDRLQAQQRTRAILDVEIPEVIKRYVAPGRNLAVLVEAATRAHILRTWGINPLEDLVKRHQALLEKRLMSFFIVSGPSGLGQNHRTASARGCRASTASTQPAGGIAAAFRRPDRQRPSRTPEHRHRHRRAQPRVSRGRSCRVSNNCRHRHPVLRRVPGVEEQNLVKRFKETRRKHPMTDDANAAAR